MAIYQTGGYRVKPEAVEKVKRAIEVFVKYVQENEPGTKMYLAWQEKNDPTRFLHLFIFENEAAQARSPEHRTVSRVMAVLEAVVASEPNGLRLADLADMLDAPKSTLHGLAKGLAATGYQLIAGKPTEEQWVAGKAGSASSTAKSKKAAAGKKR